MRAARTIALVFVVLLFTAPDVRGAAASGDAAAEPIGPTPPRLSYVDGEVSFWRPAAPDWTRAELNTPLAPGDELHTGNRGTLEVQVGSRAYVRAWGDTELGLLDHEPDFLRFRVTSGHVSVDLRTPSPGRTVRLDTPHAAITLEHAGYYRVDVTPDRTTLVARRGGQAQVASAGASAVRIGPGEQLVLEGAPEPAMARSPAPEPDAWDRWNHARTDQLLDAVSTRYIPDDVYGASELDQHGTWETVPVYGGVWVPRAVPAGWVPFSTGKWIWDPFYGWTWIDTAPWGWAPFHHGRWVFVGGRWAWAPGPLVTRAVYAPALVVFFGAPAAPHAPITRSGVGWVALGWGEPLVPWWGHAQLAGRPWWGGWGGPRVVNNVVVSRTTVVHVTHVTTYRNVSVPNAVVAVAREDFGRRGVHAARIPAVDVRRLEPVKGPLHLVPLPARHVVTPASAPPPAPARRSRDAERTSSRSPSGAAPPDASRAQSPPAATSAPRVAPATGTDRARARRPEHSRSTLGEPPADSQPARPAPHDRPSAAKRVEPTAAPPAPAGETPPRRVAPAAPSPPAMLKGEGAMPRGAPPDQRVEALGARRAERSVEGAARSVPSRAMPPALTTDAPVRPRVEAAPSSVSPSGVSRSQRTDTTPPRAARPAHGAEATAPRLVSPPVERAEAAASPRVAPVAPRVELRAAPRHAAPVVPAPRAGGPDLRATHPPSVAPATRGAEAQRAMPVHPGRGERFQRDMPDSGGGAATGRGRGSRGS